MVRPQDLRLPFTRENPRVVFSDQFWYMLSWIDPSSFVFPGWDQLFGRSAPVIVEYCSGHGHWIVEKAKASPEKNFIAVEKRFDRARKIWTKIKNQGITNCIVACAEGGKLTSSYFPSSSIEEVYINFPDPWPKNRHAKHRIINEEFLKEIARVLIPEGTFIFVTDDEPYSEYFIEQINKEKSFSHAIPNPHYTKLPDDYGISFFEELFRQQGKINRFHKVALASRIIR